MTIKTRDTDKISMQADSDDNAESGAETAEILMMLVTEEANLRYQADRLESHIKELENDGDDVSKNAADQLRRQEGLVLAAATEMRQTITEIKSDPTKKITRRKAGALQANAGLLISMSEDQAEAADAAHDAVVDHKQEKIGHTMAAPKAEPKKTVIGKVVHAVKSTVGIKDHAPIVAPKKQEPQHTGLHHCWDAAQHGLAHAAEHVEHAFSAMWQGTAHVVGSLYHGTVDVAKSAYNMVRYSAPGIIAAHYGSKIVNATLHPIDTAKKIAGVVAGAAKAVWNWLPGFGSHEEMAEQHAPIVVPVKTLTEKAKLAALKVAIPLSVSAPTHHTAADVLMPVTLMTFGHTPAAPGIS